MEVRFFFLDSAVFHMCLLECGQSIDFRGGNKAQAIPILTLTTDQRLNHDSLCALFHRQRCCTVLSQQCLC